MARRGSLAQYHQKRRFEATPEPRGTVKGNGAGKSFVVQRHDARRLHYDFRLELDGVLKSWAIPKGPSLVAGDKRLAVQTEDHPLEYGGFEGAIPEGEYGAGHVLIWDRGVWIPRGDPHQGLERGRLSFTLEGDKLHGGFSLVRMSGRREGGKDQWLLLKSKDEHAAGAREPEITRGQPPPQELAPMLATLAQALPAGAGWIFEPKLDGYRAIGVVEGGRARLYSRTGQDWTRRYSAITAAIAELPIESVVLDGEICALDDEDRPSFQRMQRATEDDARLVYFLFDLPFVDGFDLRDRPLHVRKAILESITRGVTEPLSYVAHLEGKEGAELFELACKNGLEGVIAKRKDGRYLGKRSREWIKVKCHQRQELAIAGFTAPKGSRTGVGALLLGYREPDGTLRYAGKVGTGFSHQMLTELHRKLAPLEVDRAKVEGAPRIRAATWVEPKLVAEVAFSEWTEDGSLRHPTFLGLREDKTSAEVTRERPIAAPRSSRSSRPADEAVVAGVRISNPDRVIDRPSGLTKLGLARYIEAVSERMLPLIYRRPLALLRCPEGDQAACFFQKQRMPGMPAAILASEIDGHGVLYVEDLRGLISLVQFGTIEDHAWGCRMPLVTKPDWLVFDLDPDTALPFEVVVEAALSLRKLLGKLGLETFVKTTGGKGLHVVAPVEPKREYEQVKDFTHAVARLMVEAEPDLYVAVMSKRRRKNKIFVDYLRNGSGATAIAPYSARARPGAPVACPVSWRDLRRVDPRELDVYTVPKLLAGKRKDPWEPLLKVAQTLPV
jgi:bifunctional non-homologous end joining protein LigD